MAFSKCFLYSLVIGHKPHVPLANIYVIFFQLGNKVGCNKPLFTLCLYDIEALLELRANNNNIEELILRLSQSSGCQALCESISSWIL